jgi:hypothetical protein
LPAERIQALSLPNEAVFGSLQRSAVLLSDRGKGHFALTELWGDGYSVWHGREEGDVLQVTPTGQIISTDK